MRKMQLAGLIVSAGLLFGIHGASATEYIESTVYRVTPGGVWVNTAEGATYIPSNSATYRVGDEEVVMSKLGTGKKVRVYYTKDYTPHYVPNEYYSLHTDWDWDHHWSSWEKDKDQWVRDDTGHWRRR